MKELLVVAASPHITAKENIRTALRLVILALMPALCFSIFLFGVRVLLIVVVSIASSVLCEAALQRILGRSITITDGSAFLTGLLLAFNLPPGVPLWLPAAGGAFAIIFAKQLFGGLGYNFVNPALAGRAFLTASWPLLMTKAWVSPIVGTVSGVHTITGATPLTVLKNPANYGAPATVIQSLNDLATIKQLFLGTVGGCIGETSALLLIGGGLFLLAMRIIDYRIVVGYLGSFIVLMIVLPTRANVLFHLFSGGLVLGAFFMATDWVTSPITRKGRWIFGIGCGIMTAVIRLWGGFPEGVCYSILLMNVFTPTIDRLTKERVFGERVTKEKNV